MTAIPSSTHPQGTDFEGLFAREFERCVRVARRIIGREDLARDLAAEAFARAWARWPSLRHQQPGAWVVRVTVNLAIDTTRRRVAQIAAPAFAQSPEDSSITKLTLAAALRALPVQQRTAIALRYLADYSEADVATALEVSKGTVKVHLHRGLIRLRGALDPAVFYGTHTGD